MATSTARTAAGPAVVRGEKLSRAIGISHLSWSFEGISTADLTGDVISRAVGPLRISWVNLRLGSKHWSGARRNEQIQSNPEPYLIVVMPLHGSIRLVSSSRTTLIAENELGVWDSTQAMAFEISAARYEQVSVLVPQRVLRARSDACAALHCAHVDKTNVLSELCVQHMSTLTRFLNSELRPYEISLSSVTTSLFDAMIASLYRAPRDRELLLDEIKNYIECYINDEDLSPGSVAAAFEISTRYAHKLFEHDGCTIGEWVLARRLDRSAEDLLAADNSITDIAFKWGFKDLGHYSRTFKARFGRSPSVYRREALPRSGTASP